MDDEPRLFRSAAEQFDALVAAVPNDRWGAPTPCVDWDVRALVHHLVDEMLWVPPLFDGETIESVGDRFAGDILGDDPAGAFRAAMGPAVERIEQPGAMATVCALSMGPTPGAEYTRQMIVDLTVHAWDLARGAGLDHTIDPDLAAACVEFTEPWKPMLGQMPDYFAAPIEPAEGADVQTVLLNTLGRRT